MYKTDELTFYDCLMHVHAVLDACCRCRCRCCCCVKACNGRWAAARFMRSIVRPSSYPTIRTQSESRWVTCRQGDSSPMHMWLQCLGKISNQWTPNQTNNKCRPAVLPMRPGAAAGLCSHTIHGHTTTHHALPAISGAPMHSVRCVCVSAARLAGKQLRIPLIAILVTS
jgi:hypothetical protein